MSIDITVNETIEVVDITALNNIIEVNITRQSGGGAVDSVNGQTGDVVLNAGDVGAYTTGEVDTLLLDKFDNPTGNNTQYLDGAGTPTTFPTIPAAQVNSDWNATSGVAEILNKPTIPAAQVQSDWAQANTNAVDFIKNKPTIPSVTGFVPYTGATQNVDLGEYQIKAGQFELDQSPTGTAGVAVTRWNNTLGSTETTLKGGSVVLKNGVDLVARVVNKVTPNTTLTKAAYQAVRVTGAQGQRLAVAFAQANNDNNSADTIGLVCETIATNQEGFILTVGQLEDINTTGALQGETWTDGDVLYLSPTTAGRLTNVKPTGATGHIVVIGYVEYAHANHGKIYVKIMNGWELDELHNVNISSPTNNQILAYTSASQLWQNKSVETALGYTPENVANKQTNLTASATNYPTVDAVNTGLESKITLNNWVDISLTSTIVGWSALTVRTIRYLDVGNAFIYYIFLNGTSNSTNVTFTIDYTPTISLPYFGALIPINNGNFLTGLAPANLTAASNIVTIPLAQNSGATWLASGTKSVRGIIIVPKL